MLYKKYHRNYIRRFKEGTKFKFSRYGIEIDCEVVGEPFINLLFPIGFSIDISVIKLAISDLPVQVPLMYGSGIKDGSIKFIKNAIQEISQELH